MKKLMALVTALLLICTLAGCGGAPLKKPPEQDTLALLREPLEVANTAAPAVPAEAHRTSVWVEVMSALAAAAAVAAVVMAP